MINRRRFLSGAACGIAAPSFLNRLSTASPPEHRIPADNSHMQTVKSYIEDTPVPEYHWASESAYEAFRDMKYGVRIHWGIYSVAGLLHESWPFLDLDYAKRDRYNELYKAWNPRDFDANQW